MPTTPDDRAAGRGSSPRARGALAVVRAEVARWRDRLGPGLVGVACSGGADSMALADAAIDVCGASNVLVIHVDHRLSPGSRDVARDVAAWAKARGAAAVIREVSVAPGASLEAAARDARYAALDAVAREVGASSIWLAHTRRDQAETVLMRVVRGTGPAGLAAMAAVRDRFVRPLLDLPREAIDAYVRARALPVWTDPMNADPRFARVRFRERYLPLLREENAALDDALCRLAASAAEWSAALDALAEPLVRAPLHCGQLRDVPAAVRKRVYARVLEEAGLGYDAAHLEHIDALVTRDSAGQRTVEVSGGRAMRTYDTLVISAGVTPADEAAPLQVPPGHHARCWQPGDRMKPARLKGRSRKLSDLYIDAKIPRDQRASARVVIRERDGEIVWADHVGAAWGEPPDLVQLAARTSGRF
jgi:tRNA(Ile)-lysidine synthase